MRAAPRRPSTGHIPEIDDWRAMGRNNFRQTFWASEASGTYDAVCLACPDLPCATLSATELASDIGIEMSFSPNSVVCPVEAIATDELGRPAIDDAACIRCGACITRCPVGAIWAPDPGSAPVVIRQSDIPIRPASGDFAQRRTRIAEALHRENRSVDQRILKSQYDAVLAGLDEAHDAGELLRRLVRSVMNINGVPVRLKNMGDNSAPSEALARLGTHVLSFEIQPHGDEISGVRRLLAGTARLAARYSVPLQRIVPVLVLEALPNRRAGLYELLEDVAARLGLAVRVLPVGMLLALAASPAAAPIALFDSGLRVTRHKNTLPSDFADVTGLPPSLSSQFGLDPDK